MKTISEFTAARDMKSMCSAGEESIPKPEMPGYLELHAARREKDTLENELLALDRRRVRACRELGSIKRRIKKLEEEVYEQQKSKNQEEP